jgi:WD40 repeat protein
MYIWHDPSPIIFVVIWLTSPHGCNVASRASAKASVRIEPTSDAWFGVTYASRLTSAAVRPQVTSVQISRNGKYILSAGKDNTCRLFDISAGMDTPQCVHAAVPCFVVAIAILNTTAREEYYMCAVWLSWLCARVVFDDC